MIFVLVKGQGVERVSANGNPYPLTISELLPSPRLGGASVAGGHAPQSVGAF